ncbi:uncharacterized protein VTP21DRAFT_4286 [Calcarisporiella thermophila]|uniref:uncharacterized protein n=1 Tax=Calcarisporiella thermophila TaxID=911321 RepID=UPI00374217DB
MKVFAQAKIRFLSGSERIESKAERAAQLEPSPLQILARCRKTPNHLLMFAFLVTPLIFMKTRVERPIKMPEQHRFFELSCILKGSPTLKTKIGSTVFPFWRRSSKSRLRDHCSGKTRLQPLQQDLVCAPSLAL